MTTRVGLRFPDTLTFDSWRAAGRQLGQAVDSFAWCIGDWLVYGQQHYPDRYRYAVGLVDLDYQTLRNYASVARRVEPPQRRSSLSFQHHAEVAALPPHEQIDWLARAEQEKWSRNQLRIALRGLRKPKMVRPEVPLSPLQDVSVTSDRLDRWRAAAESTNHVFEEWVLAALDRAADSQLCQ